jgi:hypothetical protein
MQTSGDVSRTAIYLIVYVAARYEVKGRGYKGDVGVTNWNASTFTARPQPIPAMPHAYVYRWRLDQLQCTACVVTGASVKQSTLWRKMQIHSDGQGKACRSQQKDRTNGRGGIEAQY